ncbi:polyprenyl synthetase family protein [Streptomyces mirabilis]|uniref:polyprenyl synthetase family protein n=1 Tax=Streptomyces mirabilis TaxID=68239 RepID=UPI00210A0D55|nr:polyprenyl synthetase family protein [Streptomyces mirabilis]
MIESVLDSISVVRGLRVRSMSYLDLHRRFSVDIDAEMEATLERLSPQAGAVRAAVAELVRNREFTYPLSVLPLIVHAVETGAPEPAVPLAVVHELWWISACHLDDLADGQSAHLAGDLGGAEALLAALVSGTPLPLLVVQSQAVPESVRGALAAEIVKCGIVAAEGQLTDLRGDVATATRDSVVTAYRGKSGAPFSMVTAMAAELAGVGKERVELWRDFGDVFGILWQMFNDQEDILSGRNEDLLNGTVTYLLACALDTSASRSTERILRLHADARNSRDARAELIDTLLTPVVLGRYEDDIYEFRGEAHRILDELGGDEPYLSVMRNLVDESSRMLLRAGLAREVTVG